MGKSKKRSYGEGSDDEVQAAVEFETGADYAAHEANETFEHDVTVDELLASLGTNSEVHKIKRSVRI